MIYCYVSNREQIKNILKVVASIIYARNVISVTFKFKFLPHREYGPTPLSGVVC